MNANSLVNDEADQAFDAAVGARVRDFRLLADMSQTDLGRAIGVSFQQVQKYELGINRIAASRLCSIARALDIPMSTLLGEGVTPSEPAHLLQVIATPGFRQLMEAYVDCSPSNRRILSGMARELAGQRLQAATP